jgi:hypothetical protein
VPVLRAIGDEDGCGAGLGPDRSEREEPWREAKYQQSTRHTRSDGGHDWRELLGGKFVVAGGVVAGAVLPGTEGMIVVHRRRCPSPVLTISAESSNPWASSTTSRGNRFGKDLEMHCSSSSTSLLDAPVHRSSSAIDQDVTSTRRLLRLAPVLALEIDDLVAAAARAGSTEGSRGRRPAGALGAAHRGSWTGVGQHRCRKDGESQKRASH